MVRRIDPLDTFFLICGESGCGKTTILNKLENDYGLIQLKSYTTRYPRYEGEKGHIFVSKKEFDLLYPKVAYTKYSGFEYCATSKQIDECDLLTIDPLGINYFKNAYTGIKKIKIVYIFVSQEERIFRMKQRGDSIENILKRVEYDEQIFKGIERTVDKIINNGKFEESVSELLQYINQNLEG